MENENLVQDIDSQGDTSNVEESGKGRYLFALWITFCIFFTVWFFKVVLRGRRRLQHNFDLIERQLRQMQNAIEKQEENEAISDGTLNDLIDNIISDTIVENEDDKKTQ